VSRLVLQKLQPAKNGILQLTGIYFMMHGNAAISVPNLEGQDYLPMHVYAGFVLRYALSASEM
jgi:hypothetical protein